MEKNNWLGWVIGIIIVVGLGYLIFAKGTPSTKESAPASSTSTPSAIQLPEEIKIGFIGPLTGDAASLGVPLQKAVLLAAEEVNAQGGIGGKKVVILSEDGKCDGKESSNAAQRLMNVSKVQAIIGGTCSGETLGFAPIANENKVVVVSPSASSPDITNKGGEYLFRVVPSDGLAGKVGANYAANELKAKKAAVISENTEYAQGLSRVFKDNLKQSGGEIVVDEVYNTGTTDFHTQALKIKNAQADVIYIVPQSAAPGITIMKALNDQKVEVKRLTSEVLIGDEAVRANKAVLEGLIGFDPYFDSNSEAAVLFTQAYKAKYKEDLAYPFYQANAYSEMFLFKDLIEKNGYDGMKLQQALSKLSLWSGGVLKNVTLDQNGDIVWKDFNVKEARDGKAEKIKVFTVGS